MRKPSSRIREEIVRLQEQLKLAETREAERIGRIALKAGLGDIEIEESDMMAAFEEVAGKSRQGSRRQSRSTAPQNAPGAPARSDGEA